MKKITLLFTLLTVSLSFGQNLIVNGDFETGDVAPWGGFKNQVVTDDITSSLAGNINNGDGSLTQTFTVTPDAMYNVSFDYRWVLAGGAAMTVLVKDGATGGSDLGTFTLNTTVDTWFNGSFSFTAPTGVTTARIIFFKANGNRPLRIDNISITIDNTASVKDLAQFNFRSYPNPANNYIKLSAAKSINKIEVYNLLGQEVLNKDINSKNTEVNISSLSKGVYLVKAFIEDTVGTYKVIKQ